MPACTLTDHELRMFHKEDVAVKRDIPLSRFLLVCLEKIKNILLAFSAAELSDMLVDNSQIVVTRKLCTARYYSTFSLDELHEPGTKGGDMVVRLRSASFAGLLGVASPEPLVAALLLRLRARKVTFRLLNTRWRSDWCRAYSSPPYPSVRMRDSGLSMNSDRGTLPTLLVSKYLMSAMTNILNNVCDVLPFGSIGKIVDAVVIDVQASSGLEMGAVNPCPTPRMS